MPVNYQPYKPPESALPSKGSLVRERRNIQRWWLFAYLYPLVLIGAHYGTWLIAWYELGHMPRPHIDDPHSIGGVFSACVYLPLVTGVLSPFMLPLGFLASLYLWPNGEEQTKVRLRWLMQVIFVLLWMLTGLTVLLDPWGVAEWYGD